MKEDKNKLSTIALLKRDLPRFFDDEYIKKNLFKDLLIKFSETNHIKGDTERNNLILALSKNRNLWSFIDKVYEQKKYDYYSSYKNTFFVDTPLKEVYSIKTKEFINKLAGIDKWCRDNNTEEPLLKIIQKGHNRLYSKFKSGIKEINLDVFLSGKPNGSNKRNVKINRNTLDKYGHTEEVILVARYLSSIYNVEIQGYLWKKILDVYMEGLFSGLNIKLSIDKALGELKKDDLIKLLEKILDVEYSSLKLCKNLDEFYNLILIEQTEKVKKMDSVMRYEHFDLNSPDSINKKIADAFLSTENLSNLNIDTIKSNILEENLNSITDKVSSIELANIVSLLISCVKVMGLDREVLIDIPFNTNILKLALLTATDTDVEDYILNKKKVDNMLKVRMLSFISLISVLETYRNIKPCNFGKENESYIDEVKRLNNELVERDSEIKLLKEKLVTLERLKSKKTKELLDDLELSNKNIKRLKKELEELKKDHQEFLAMKEYIYKNSTDNDKIFENIKNDELSIEDKINYINKRKIAIFGGHPNWVNKLKRLIPDALYIDTNACSSRKFNRLDRYDLLVICNLFISHGLSWKVSEAIKNVKSKKVVIIDDVNTDLIINNIYKAIKVHEEN